MRRLVSGLAALAALGFAHEAHALELGTPATKAPFHSAQNFALEFRVSPYKPSIDDEPGLNGKPYEKDFGTGPRIQIGIEFDWQFYRIPGVGTIGPAVQVGYVSMSRPAKTVTGRVSGDDYSLTIWGFDPLAVLRVDTLWRNFGIPFMPYGKIGPAVGLWAASNALGTSTVNGVKGSGASPGYNLTIGTTFTLDFFDRGSQRAMDAATGINSTSVFIEYYTQNLSGFGSDSTFRVGANTWAAGMTFEF